MTVNQSKSPLTASSGHSSSNGDGIAFQPYIRPPPPSHKEREDVVALMKRDMSYSAVAAAGIQSGSDSDVESSSSSNHSNEMDKMDGSNLSRKSQRQADASNNSNSNSNGEKGDLLEDDSYREGIESGRNWVFLLLGLVVCMVIVAIAGVSAGIRKENEQQEEFAAFSEDELENTIASLTDANLKQQQYLQTTLRGFAQSLTASTTPGQWPFFTSPLFETQGKPTRQVVPAIELIAFTPFVKPAQKWAWQYFTNATQDWITTNWKLLGNETVDVGKVVPMVPSENELEICAPLWQTSPPPKNAEHLNRDLFNNTQILELYKLLLNESSNNRNTEGILSPLWPEIPELYGFGESDDTPRSVLLMPVRNQLTGDPENIRTIGLLHVIVNWDQMLQNLVPNSADWQGATVENDCSTEHYHRENKKHNHAATIAGEEDQSPEDKVLLEKILGNDFGGCPYTVEFELKSVAPDMEKSSIAGVLTLALVPLLLALIVLGFVLASLLRWMQLVDERHEKLLTQHAKSSAIVASMFPSNVRDRLYNAQGEDSTKNNQNSTRKGRKYGNNKNKSGLDADPGSSLTTSENTVSKSIPEERASKNWECHPAGAKFPPRRITQSGSERLKNYLDTGGMTNDDILQSAPIADLFPQCTVLFADIAGFTAWSSVREPSQVFTLLETLYKKFDEMAKRRNVFKVETVGDCYVAVTGLPEAQDEHALIMVRFARDCMYKSYELTKKLEVTLGPDTAELSMRFGLHSGPVTAGVLRGDRARFQLFGDTVNTASRMESTGQKGRIQMSQETADHLISLGKSHLVRQRDDPVTVKGKGEMTTYWVALGADPDDVEEDELFPPTSLSRNTSGMSSMSLVDSIIEGDEDASDDDDLLGDGSNPSETQQQQQQPVTLLPRSAPTRRKPPAVSMSGLHSLKGLRDKKKSKESRLVDWNVEILGRLLKHVIARRNALGLEAPDTEVKLDRPEGQTVLEEVREIITLPKFDASAAKKQEDPEKVALNSAVKEQLREYVSTLASMYRENPFHNYEHASHVTMSVVKLLSRIVAPKINEKMTSEEKLASKLHDHTYGITSDPLTQFAVVLAALIHDVDHTGVPNSQLVKENARVAEFYKGKSVAEQNSLDLSWELLEEPQFQDLRNAIYCNEAELTRFRSLLVNTVMATDIVDKELKQLRNNRWDKAFSGEDPKTEDEIDAAVNRKATIVLEHLIQASDVSHTMQHWHVYRKWNERLFEELYNAYRAGRAEKDPSEFWYKGEIGFFDFYIIPLAKKLKDCGVFGVSSDEYLNYATKNREEWERRGEAVTAEMVAKARDKDLARMERQASMRGPLIAEMKQAVLSMRSPKKESDMFRQASFRHLQTEPESTESIAMPDPGYRRQPPRQRTPNRRALRSAVSIGTAERNALKQYRQAQPGRLRGSGSGGIPAMAQAVSAPSPASINEHTPTEKAPDSVGENTADSKGEDGPIDLALAKKAPTPKPDTMGIRKPERRGSNI